MSFSIPRIKMSLITSYVRLYFRLFFEHDGANPNITDDTKFEILHVPSDKPLRVQDTQIYKMIPENCKNLFNNIKHFYEYKYLCYPNTFSMKEMFDILTMTGPELERTYQKIQIDGVNYNKGDDNNDFYLVVYDCSESGLYFPFDEKKEKIDFFAKLIKTHEFDETIGMQRTESGLPAGFLKIIVNNFQFLPHKENDDIDYIYLIFSIKDNDEYSKANSKHLKITYENGRYYTDNPVLCFAPIGNKNALIKIRTIIKYNNILSKETIQFVFEDLRLSDLEDQQKKKIQRSSNHILIENDKKIRTDKTFTLNFEAWFRYAHATSIEELKEQIRRLHNSVND